MSKNTFIQNPHQTQPEKRQHCFSDPDFIPCQCPDKPTLSIKKAFMIFVVLAAIMLCHVYYINAQVNKFVMSYNLYDEALVTAQANIPQYLSHFNNAEVYDVVYKNFYDPEVIPNFEKADYDFDAAVLEALKGGDHD